MNRKNTTFLVRSHMVSADPAAKITDDELTRSRDRSLMAMQQFVHEAAPKANDAAAMADVADSAAPSVLSARRARRMRIGLTSVAAAAVVAALITGDVVGLAGWRGGATAQAAEVLNNAAQITIKTADPTVNPGQYLKIQSTNVWSTTSVEADGSSYEWLDTEKSEMYIPADRGAEWVWQRSGRVPTTFFDAKTKDFVASQNIQPHPELLRAASGAFYGSPGGPFATDMSTRPRDPYRLLNSIYKQTLGHGPSVDGEALVFIADLLRTGIVPADLRAALYKAAAMIPGVTITEGQANLNGRTGVAIGRSEGSVTGRQEIIIDPETGQLIGERAILTEPHGSIPAGTAATWTAIETTVVSEAP
jgi:hypothetical protein